MPFWSGLFTAGASAVATKQRRPSLDAAAAKLRALANARRSERTVFWKDYKEFLGNPPQPPAEPNTPTGYRFRTRVPLRIDPGARELLEQLAKDIPAGRLTSRRHKARRAFTSASGSDSSREVMMTTGAPGLSHVRRSVPRAAVFWGVGSRTS